MINFKFYTRSIYSSFQFNTSNPYSSTWFRQTFDQRWRAVRFFSSDKILNPSLMYILSDTRFKEQISSSAFTVRGHRSHRYASGFQNDRRLRLTTKGWNPLPFFRLTIAPLRYMHILPSTSSLFFFFLYSASSIHCSRKIRAHRNQNRQELQSSSRYRSLFSI